MAPVLDPTSREIRYVGRPESASPATGSGKRHQAEQSAIVEDALTRGAVSAPKLVRKKKSHKHTVDQMVRKIRLPSLKIKGRPEIFGPLRSARTPGRFFPIASAPKKKKSGA